MNQGVRTLDPTKGIKDQKGQTRLKTNATIVRWVQRISIESDPFGLSIESDPFGPFGVEIAGIKCSDPLIYPLIWCRDLLWYRLFSIESDPFGLFSIESDPFGPDPKQS